MRILLSAFLLTASSLGLAQVTPGLGSVVDVTVAFPGCPSAVGNGLNDDSFAFQCHADYLSNAGNGYAGGVVHVPAGTYYFGNTVVVPQLVSLEGVGEGSVISQKHVFKGTMVKLRRGSNLRRLKFTQEQPPFASTWTPYTDYDFQIAVTQDRVNVEDIMLLSPTNGISIRSDNFPASLASVGQIYLRNIRGQPLMNGIVIDGALDIIRINDVHFWPFWSNDAGVRKFVKENGYGIRSYRNDNPFFSQIFTFAYKVGFQFGKSPGGNYPPVTGITSRPRIKGFDCDACLYGIVIDGDGTNGVLVSEAQILGAEPSSYSPITVTASYVSASISQLDSTWSSGNVVRISGDYNSVIVSNSIIRFWNRAGIGTTFRFPAFEIAEGKNNILQVTDTFYGEGYGALPARAVEGTLIVRDLTYAPAVAR